MRRSLLRLVVSSVLLTWVLGILLAVLFARSVGWTEQRARIDGVFLAHELLDQTPAAARPERARALQPHFRFGLHLISLEQASAQIGRPLRAGEWVARDVNSMEATYLIAFADGGGALAAGPFNPKIPIGFLPIGFLFAFVAIPAIAGLIALRVERQMLRVERATEALAEGELGARVDNQRGPSNELAERFNAMAERVERLIRSRDELVQAVSHELGSPLSRLRFHLELLETTSVEPSEHRFDAMTRELDALDELVAELLGYVQSDELRVEVAEFDPRRGLRDLAEIVRLDLPSDRAIEVDVALPAEATAVADQRLFLRAVENVLRNAVRHARGRARLELTGNDVEVRVTVHDDGPGIPASMREKVLVPFFRLDSDRHRRSGGAGLGLAIVSRIVSRHGGGIEIGDSPLGGAQVTTIWPRSGGR